MSERKVIQGLKLFPWQKDVIQDVIQDGPDAENIYVVLSRRQLGKSLMLEQLLLHSAINYPKSISICISITLNQCRKIYRELYNGIIDMNIISRSNEQTMEIELVNGSQIIFKSAVQKEALRGFTVRNGGVLIFDEGAFIQDEIYNISFPFVSVNKANIIITSTPRIKQGTFYELYSEGLSGTNPHVRSYDWSDPKYDTSNMLSKEKLELYRRTLPENQFLNEFMGVFTDDVGSVFQLKHIKFSNTPPNPNTYSKIYIGIDWGAQTGNDYTALSAFNEHHQQLLLKYNNTLSPQEIINWIVKNINENLDIKKIDTILVESNSIGAIYYDLLKSALPKLNIKTFTTTNSSKREIVEDFCFAIGNDEITLLEDEEQYKQLSMYEMEITKSGLITYNASYSAHDDITIADCLAYHSSKKSTTNYTVSFAKKPNSLARLKNKYE